MVAELVSIDDVTEQLTRVKDSDLTALQRVLDSACLLLADMCLPLVPATVTDLLDGGQPSVVLSTYPVNAVTSVSTLDASGPTAILEAGGSTGVWDGWRLDPLAGVLHRVGCRAWPLGWGNVEVIYTVGPDTVPANVQEAAIVLTQHLWQFRKVGHQPDQPGGDPMGFSPSYAIPTKVIELVRDYLKPARVA